MKKRAEHLSDWALIGSSLTAAFLATSCCLAPMLFLLFGISIGSLGFLKFFAPYQLPLSLFAGTIVAVLWYRHLRTSATACSATLCGRYRYYLIAATLFVTMLVSYTYWLQLFLEDA